MNWDPETERRLLYSLLGDLPERERPVRCRVVATEERRCYRLEHLVLDLNGLEDVPALLTLPLEASPPYPGVLYNHSHGGDYRIGKRELIEGREYMQTPPYAEALAARGVAALSIDHWCFGERSGKTESETFKEMLWHGRVLWGMMVYDSLRAIDYLSSRPDIASGRIGTVGMSMGSTMAWWLAALDKRIRVCVDICCMTDFHALIESRGLDLHGVYYYVPNLLKHFTTARINALIAPRPHLSLVGNKDLLTPPAGLDRIDESLRKVYTEAGVPEHWAMIRYDVGHLETAAMRARVLEFLERHL